MSYDLDQMIVKFRQDMDDTETPYLWSDDEIIDFLDEAEDEFTDRVDAVADTLTLTYSAAQDYLDIPYYVTRVRSGYDAEGMTLKLYNEEEWNNALVVDDYGLSGIRTSWRSDTGVPRVLITDILSGKARMYPIPEADGTLYLNVYRRPMRDLATRGKLDVTDRAQQRCILIRARSLGYNKHDSDVYNPAMAQQLYQEFRAEADKLSQRIRRSRRRAKPVAYGGI